MLFRVTLVKAKLFVAISQETFYQTFFRESSTLSSVSVKFNKYMKIKKIQQNKNGILNIETISLSSFQS